MTDQAPPPSDPNLPSDQNQPVDYSSTPSGGLFDAPPYTGPEPDQDAKTMGMLAHLLAIFFHILGPLLIWLIKKDQHPFINDQSKEALNFQLTLVALWLIIALLACITLGLGMLLIPVLLIANLVLCILAALKANKGIAYRYPFAARFIK